MYNSAAGRMCILFLHYQPREPAFPYLFIAASNRDEKFHRKTTPAAFWEDHPNLLASRDIHTGPVDGGTWLGITREGRFGTLTNYRSRKEDIHPQARSRGHIVLDYLLDQSTPQDYSRRMVECGHEYNGYSLIAGAFGLPYWMEADAPRPKNLERRCPPFTSSQLVYSTNKEGSMVKTLEPGTYGLSNQLLDSPWQKVVRGKERFSEIIEQIQPSTSKEELSEHLIQLLCDDTCLHPDPNVPDTGHSEEMVRARNSIFVKPVDSETQYGTRTNTVVLVSRLGEVTFTERTIDPSTCTWTTNSFSFHINGS